MPPFDIEASLERARERLGRAAGGPRRRARSDRGVPRLPRAVLAEVRRALGGQERPRMARLLETIAARCERKGLAAPSRATVYRLIDRLPVHRYPIAALPGPARAALYNLSPEDRVPGGQLAFSCFHYGDVAAMSFAAGLPWIDLHQARRKRGWRERSRGVLDAVCAARRI